MPDKLVEIMAWKRKEIASRIRAVSEGELARLDGSLPKPPPLQAALVRTDGTLAVIAEIKRRSPSAGEIAAGASAVERARAYHAAGANALSVLTDGKFFGGELQDLEQVTEDLRASAIPLPCLRKDFMVHPIQVLEARQSGASAVLLIVRALDDEEIRVLHGAAVAAGLAALFEVHTQQELGRAVAHGARLIGVNNRDLSAFTTDLSLSERLIPLFPPGVVAISESGINSAADASRVRKAGARAVLVGESLMRSPDPSGLLAAIRSA